MCFSERSAETSVSIKDGILLIIRKTAASQGRLVPWSELISYRKFDSSIVGLLVLLDYWGCSGAVLVVLY
jgi:hypothetical protein